MKSRIVTFKWSPHIITFWNGPPLAEEKLCALEYWILNNILHKIASNLIWGDIFSWIIEYLIIVESFSHYALKLSFSQLCDIWAWLSIFKVTVSSVWSSWKRRHGLISSDTGRCLPRAQQEGKENALQDFLACLQQVHLKVQLILQKPPQKQVVLWSVKSWFSIKKSFAYVLASLHLQES